MSGVIPPISDDSLFPSTPQAQTQGVVSSPISDAELFPDPKHPKPTPPPDFRDMLGIAQPSDATAAFHSGPTGQDVGGDFLTPKERQNLPRAAQLHLTEIRKSQSGFASPVDVQQTIGAEPESVGILGETKKFLAGDPSSRAWNFLINKANINTENELGVPTIDIGPAINQFRTLYENIPAKFAGAPIRAGASLLHGDVAGAFGHLVGDPASAIGTAAGIVPSMLFRGFVKPLGESYINLVSGGKYNTPEESYDNARQLAVNYGSLLLAGAGGAEIKGALAEREIAGALDMPVSRVGELGTEFRSGYSGNPGVLGFDNLQQLRASIRLSLGSRTVAGIGEGTLGAVAAGGLEGVTNKDKQIDVAGAMASYALMSLPIGLGFEALGGAGEAAPDVKDFFRLKQYQKLSSMSPDAAAVGQEMYADTKKLNLSLLQTYDNLGNKALTLTNVSPEERTSPEFVAALGKNKFAHYIRSDGNLDVLVGGKNSPVANPVNQAEFANTGYMPGEVVSFSGTKNVFRGRGPATAAGDNNALLEDINTGKTQNVPFEHIQRASDVQFNDPIISMDRDLAKSVVREPNKSPAEAGEIAGVPLKVDYPSAEWAARNPKKITGYTVRPLQLDPKTLLDIPGLKGEETRINQENVTNLAASMKSEGFKAGNEPLVVVEADGKPYILEGNHRIRAAAAAGLDKIPVEVKYYGGGEQLASAWRPAGSAGIGKLLTVYHGTASAFTEPDVAKARVGAAGTGFYTTTDPVGDASDTYAFPGGSHMSNLIESQKAQLEGLQDELQILHENQAGDWARSEDDYNRHWLSLDSKIAETESLIEHNQKLFAAGAPEGANLHYVHLNIQKPFDFGQQEFPLELREKLADAAVAMRERNGIASDRPVDTGFNISAEPGNIDNTAKIIKLPLLMKGEFPGYRIHGMLSEIVGGHQVNDLLQQFGYDGIFIPRETGHGRGDHWIAFRNDQIIQPWVAEHIEAQGTTAPTPTRLLNKVYSEFKDFAHINPDNLDGSVPQGVSFDQLIQSYAKQSGFNGEEIPQLSDFIESKLHQELLGKVLTPDEVTRYNTILKSANTARKEAALDVSKAAVHAGLSIDQLPGSGIIIRDIQSGDIVHRTNSPTAAMEFVRNAGAADGPNLDSGGGSAIPPRVFGSGLAVDPPPPGSPASSDVPFIKQGALGHLRDWFNLSFVGRHFTQTRSVMEAFDNKFDTRLMAAVHDPLEVAFKRKYANVRPEIQRFQQVMKIGEGLDDEQLAHIANYRETIATDDIPKPRKDGGLLDRGMNAQEIQASQWLAGNQIDIHKAYLFNNLLGQLERTRDFRGGDPAYQNELVNDLMQQMDMDKAHLQAATILREGAKQEPGNYSNYAVVRYANGIMHGDLSPADYAKVNNMSPQAMAYANAIGSHLDDLTQVSELPDERKLGGYFAHFREFKDDQPITLKNGVQLNTTNLLRTGEMSEYERDPATMYYRYINMVYNSKYTSQPLDAANAYLNSIENKFGGNGKYMADWIRKYHIANLRGIPFDGAKMSSDAFESYLKNVGIDLPGNVKDDVVNALLSFGTTTMIGFKPAQGLRDGLNIISAYYTRFGTERTAQMLRTISKWTPEQLHEAGIINTVVPGESPQAALVREGVQSGLSPIQVQTAEERANNSAAVGVLQKLRSSAVQIGDVGLKWSLQHSVYQWAHSAVYLESLEKVYKELTNMNDGTYGEGAAAKQKAYNNLTLDSYAMPTRLEFDRLVKSGNYQAAGEFLARATSFETVGTFGLGNIPAGWNTNFGRIFGQFGNWSVWQRSQLMRAASQGSVSYRAGVAARFALSQGAVKAASVATGFNLGSWYLPFAGAAVAAASHVNGAIHEYDPQRQRELATRAAYDATIGVPASGIFRGGPLFQLLATSVEFGAANERGDDRGSAEAYSQLLRAWTMGEPGVVGDVLGGVELMKNGYNPISAMAKGIGISQTKNPSLLNPYGIQP